MNIFKKCLAILMAGLMIASTLTACTQKKDGSGETSGTEGQAGQADLAERYSGLTPKEVYDALSAADQVKITVTERGAEDDGTTPYEYSTLIERAGDTVALTSSSADYTSVEYVDFEKGYVYYEKTEGEWVTEPSYYEDWADLLTMFSEDGYEFLFVNDHFTADGDRFTLTPETSAEFFEQYGGALAETHGEQDVKLNAGMTREGTRYTFRTELLTADNTLLAGSDVTVEFCETSVTLPEAAPLEPDGTEEADPPETLPDDTLLTSELYASLDFTQYLEIPDLSTLKAPLKTVEAQWESYVNRVRYDSMTFTDAPAGAAASLNDEVNIHYKGYAAYAEDQLSEGTLANMTNIAYDEEGVLYDGYDLVLGSGSFVGAYENADAPEKNNRGFEEQLVGMKVGETRTITVTFPDNYGSEELNGTVIKFDVTVNGIRKGTLPELTDKLLADYLGDDNATVESVKAEAYAYYKSIVAYDTLFEAFAVRIYPDRPIDSAVTDYVTDYVSSVYEEKLTDEELQTVFEEQYENALAYARKAVGERMILEYLFSFYQVTMTQGEYVEARDADLEQNFFEYYYYYGISDAATLEAVFGKDLLVAQYKYEKLLPVLAEKVAFE